MVLGSLADSVHFETDFFNLVVLAVHDGGREFKELDLLGVNRKGSFFGASALNYQKCTRIILSMMMNSEDEN